MHIFFFCLLSHFLILIFLCFLAEKIIIRANNLHTHTPFSFISFFLPSILLFLFPLPILTFSAHAQKTSSHSLAVFFSRFSVSFLFLYFFCRYNGFFACLYSTMNYSSLAIVSSTCFAFVIFIFFFL